MSRAPHFTGGGIAGATDQKRRALSPGVEYEFEKLTLSRDLSRSVVTRMLTDRAERGGWELARLLLFPDGTRKVTLRRKIIRQTRPSYVFF